MPLEIIKGPPNSGRTEELRRRYIHALRRNPVLVVPSTDDIFTWQERLTRERGAFLGGRVMHFRDLVGEILGRNPMDRSDIAGTLRRRQVAAEALRSAWPAVGRRLGSQPGLIDAALRAFDELQSGRIDPETIEYHATRSSSDPDRERGSSLLEPIGQSYREYLDRLRGLGLKDDPGLAATAVAAPLEGWESRPVFVAGFDDLNPVQLELLVRLATVTRVTVAITHEDNSPAMAVTDRLLSRLREHGEDTPARERISAAEAGRSPVLHEIERRFLREDPEWGPLEADGSITLIQASGTRGEAEAVGAEIARLIDAGTIPDEIAIAVSSPAVNGRVFRDVLTEYGVAATLECETPAPATAIGQAAVDMLRAASPEGSAGDLFRYLRGPVGADREAVDLAEYRVVRAGITTAGQAAAVYRRVARAEPPFLGAVRGRSPGEAVCEAVQGMVTTLLGSVDPGLAGTGVETEAQMATAIKRAVAELESIHGERLNRSQILDALLSGAVSTWAIPTGNTVHIASPYSLRAKRVEHLFMVSLQESDPGAGDLRGGPFLGRAVRETLGMPKPNDPEEQEQYLFHSCLSVPTEGLYLSCRIADENGKAEYPSPLIGQVTALFGPEAGDGRNPSCAGIEVLRRSASDILFSLEQAPSETEVIRSLAAIAPTEDRSGPSGLPPVLARRGRELVGFAEDVERDTRTLSDLTDPDNLERLATRTVFSPTALESFTSCPYRWLIERGLNLERFGPEPEYFSRGTMIHEVLATLFSDRAGQRPRPDTLHEWLAAIGPAIEEAATGLGLDPVSGPPETIIMLRGIRADVEGQIRLEAGFEEPHLDPRYFEVSFGFSDSEKGALEFDGENPDGLPATGWELCGRIDRVDVSGDPAVGQRGVVIDYKSGNGSILSWADTVRQRRLQLQLYLKALNDLWRIRPIAGLYQPVVRGPRRPRGPIDIESYDDVAFMGTFDRDAVDIGAAIGDATADANRAVARIRAGMIEHDPLACPDHFEHAAVPDWQHRAGQDGGNE